MLLVIYGLGGGHTHTHADTHTHTYSHTHTRARARTHTQTHTHTFFGKMKVISRNQACCRRTPGLKTLKQDFCVYLVVTPRNHTVHKL